MQVVFNPGMLANALARGFEIGYNTILQEKRLQLQKQAQELKKELANLEKERLEWEKQKFEDRITRLNEISKRLTGSLKKLGFENAEDIAGLFALDPKIGLAYVNSILNYKLKQEEQNPVERWTPVRSVITVEPKTKKTIIHTILASNKGATKAVPLVIDTPLPKFFESQQQQTQRPYLTQPYTVFVKDITGKTKAVTLLPTENPQTLPALVIDPEGNIEFVENIKEHKLNEESKPLNEDEINKVIQTYGIPLEEVGNIGLPEH